MTEVLVYVHGNWHIAHKAINTVTGKEYWESRDGSYICDVGKEKEIHKLPKNP